LESNNPEPSGFPTAPLDNFDNSEASSGFPEPSFNQPQPTQSFSPIPSSTQPQIISSQNPNPQQNLMSKDIEILSAKIDSLRATLENINQRLANIERIANEENKSPYGYRNARW